MRRKEQKIGVVLENLIEKLGMKEKINEVRLKSAWGDLMGDLIAKRTNRITIKNDKLIIYLNSSTLKNELNLNRTKILSDLKNNFPTIENIKEIIFL